MILVPCRHYMLAPTQVVFTFVHPNSQDPIDNTRYKRFTFSRPASSGSAIMHGFAG
jgi:protein arginine N-methyltransferase 5